MNIYHENQVPWPITRPYTESRKNGPFKTSVTDACNRIETSVAMFRRPLDAQRTKELWIYVDGGETGVRNRFRSNQRAAGCAVAVRFDLDGKEYNICADRYNDPAQNLAGIAAYIEAIRAQERNGIISADEMLHAFAALPAPKKWWEVLNVQPDCPLEVAEAAYRAMSKVAHPDKGGTVEQFNDITIAIKEARGLWNPHKSP